MSRSRILSPEFFLHERLFAQESATGLPLRLAFAGLWCQADREGRFRWRPAVLKLGILPYDNLNFEEILAALEEAALVIGYESEGETYGVIPTFAKHQKCHPREAQSVIPAPPKEARPRLALGTPKVSPRRALGRKRPPVSTSVSTSVSVSTSASKITEAPQNGADPAGPPAAENWPAEAYELWKDIGILDPGRLGRAIKPAVKEYGWAAVKPWLALYIKLRPLQRRDGSVWGDLNGDSPKNEPPRNTSFCSPDDFVKNLNAWRQRLTPIGPAR